MPGIRGKFIYNITLRIQTKRKRQRRDHDVMSSGGR